MSESKRMSESKDFSWLRQDSTARKLFAQALGVDESEVEAVLRKRAKFAEWLRERKEYHNTYDGRYSI